jgi:HD-like signal output (HDOD) protein
MSGSLPRLLASLRSGSSVKELSDQVVSDPQLLANILKVVNSPFYRAKSKKIENVDEALVILGEDGLREVIASVILGPIMVTTAVPGVDTSLSSSLWGESLKCAVTCRSFARMRGSTDPFAVFLSGLTNSVGLAATLQLMTKVDHPLSHPFSVPFLTLV